LRTPRPIGNPLELPRGTCIDVTYSGVGNTQRQFPLPQGLISPASGLIVMVTPNGSIDCIYVNGSPTKPPIASLYFLLGKAEKVANPTVASNIALTDPTIFTSLDNSNLADPNS